MSEAEIKTGICSYNPCRGKYWVLYVSNVFATVDALISFVLALVFKIGGKESLQQQFAALSAEEAAQSVDELYELNGQIQTYHTLLVCMLFLTATIQVSLVTLSTGCPCWDGFGGIKEHLKNETRFHLQEQVDDLERQQARSNREAAVFVSKHRERAAKALAKSAARP
eukprot:SAG31_NODE_5350_length_2593_cov_1.862871_4_plen_168_part_00